MPPNIEKKLAEIARSKASGSNSKTGPVLDLQAVRVSTVDLPPDKPVSLANSGSTLLLTPPPEDGKIRDLERDLKEKDKEIARLETGVAAKANENEISKHKIAEIEKKLTDLRDSMRVSGNKNERRISDLTSEKEKLEGQIVAADLEVDKLKGQLSKLESERDTEVANLKKSLEVAEAKAGKIEERWIDRVRRHLKSLAEQKVKREEVEKQRREAEVEAAAELVEKSRREAQADQERIKKAFDPKNWMLGRPDPNEIQQKVDAEMELRREVAKVERERLEAEKRAADERLKQEEQEMSDLLENIKARNKQELNRKKDKRKQAGRERRDSIAGKKEGERLKALATSEISNKPEGLQEETFLNPESLDLAKKISKCLINVRTILQESNKFNQVEVASDQEIKDVLEEYLFSKIKFSKNNYLPYPIRVKSMDGSYARLVLVKWELEGILLNLFSGKHKREIEVYGVNNKTCVDFAELCISDEERSNREENRRKLAIHNVVGKILERTNIIPKLNFANVAFMELDHPAFEGLDELLKKEGEEFVTEKNKREVMEQVMKILKEEERAAFKARLKKQYLEDAGDAPKESKSRPPFTVYEEAGGNKEVLPVLSVSNIILNETDPPRLSESIDEVDYNKSLLQEAAIVSLRETVEYFRSLSKGDFFKRYEYIKSKEGLSGVNLKRIEDAIKLTVTERGSIVDFDLDSLKAALRNESLLYIAKLRKALEEVKRGKYSRVVSQR